MAAQLDQDDEISAINITPFVDVVLVLLILLMVTSTQIVRAALQVDLPRAASGGSAVPSTLNVVIPKEGPLLLDGVESTEETLVLRVREEKGNDPDLQAVISADKGVEYGKVVRVIDLLKVNGLSKFALNIERSELAPAQDTL